LECGIEKNWECGIEKNWEVGIEKNWECGMRILDLKKRKKSTTE
jgi:hypothetical protein